MTVWAISLENIWLALQLMPLYLQRVKSNLSKQSAARPVPEKGVRGGNSLRAGEEQAQQKEGHWLHSKSMCYADRALQ